MRKDLEHLIKIYSSEVAAAGATPAGVGWPNAADLATRFEVLLSPIDFARYSAARPLKLLDLGCGPGLLLDYLSVNALLGRVDYLGVDIVGASVELARTRWPAHRFEFRDVRDSPFAADVFDYGICCGAFTGRVGTHYDTMVGIVRETLAAVWPSVRLGLGFNVMSKHVDWEREDLFHWPLDDAMAFCKESLSRHVSLRLDYGLWEFAALIRKEPVKSRSAVPARWSSELTAAAKFEPEAARRLAVSRELYERALAANASRNAAAIAALDDKIRIAERNPPALGTLCAMRVILSSGLFDREFYLASYGDVLADGIDPLDHYVWYGDGEGRRPNAVFSPWDYRLMAAPPISPQENALQHYIEHGEPAGWNASKAFNPCTYLEANPELREFVDRPLFHFLNIGRAAGLPVIGPASRPASGAAAGSAGSGGNLRIAAHLGVKDEIELIEPALAHLRAIGVDHIIACDMGSTDGTAEVLEKYRAEDFWILHLTDKGSSAELESHWLARNLELVKAAPADWILFLDADEFWIPESGNLKDCKALAGADALSVRRFNVPLGPVGALIPDAITPDRYRDILVIAEGIPRFAQHWRSNPTAPWIKGQQEPKVMARRERIGGWHTAVHHIVPPDEYTLRWAEPSDLFIAHLPFTTAARFARKIENIRQAFAGEDEHMISGDGAWYADAWHWRRWAAVAAEGRIDEEYRRNVLDAAELADMRSRGVIRSAADIFSSQRPFSFQAR